MSRILRVFSADQVRVHQHCLANSTSLIYFLTGFHDPVLPAMARFCPRIDMGHFEAAHSPRWCECAPCAVCAALCPWLYVWMSTDAPGIQLDGKKQKRK
jgi:hypothetical protein